MPVTPATRSHPGRAQRRRSPGRSARTQRSGVARRTTRARGANPRLARMVRDVRIQRFARRGRTTSCNQAFNAYAARHGFRGFEGMVANQMFKAMKAGNGWRQVSAPEAIRMAQQGKLVAAVIGEYTPGVPGIAQAGVRTFEWGPVTASWARPTSFVRG